MGLTHLGQWAESRCFEHIPSLKKLALMLLETIRYLELKKDSMPDYGKRYRGGQRISTGFVESAVNEIIAKRMAKKRQMRWNRHTVLKEERHSVQGCTPFAVVVHYPERTLTSSFSPT